MQTATTMSPTPPSKRHHLPFAMAGKNNRSSMSQRCGGKLNQVFLATCIASFFLQLFGSFISWNGGRSVSSGELVLMEPPQLRLGNEMRKLSVENEYEQEAVQTVKASESETVQLPPNRALGPPPHSRRLRVLIGIVTADFKNDYAYRKRHRALFDLWNDPRVCSLPDFKSRPVDQRYECEIIYTFVMGANPEAPPELVDDSRPPEVTRPIKGLCPDINAPDMTLLNIRENMNEGKSQTWMKYGAEIAEEYDLDYVVKFDADSILHLHEFFTFAYKHLPPAPYNKHVYVGALRDKAYWPRHTTEEERIRFESYFGNNFEGVHLYVAGQIYMVSTDLAKFIGQEALTSKCSYCEGHEDHDISAMAFHSPEPIKLLVVGRSQRFWEHPVKGEPRWKRIWARESARMNGFPFEGKVFFKNSTFDAVMTE